jgi:type I restriction enzyme S subunit
MPAGSIHFSSRAPIGYVVISSQSLCTNQGFKSLVPADGIYNGFIYYYLRSIKGLANSLATGTTFKELSGAAFSRLPLPLPPLAEQKRIVSKIEELFSELDAGEESLRRARRQLGVYRQSLLKQAFEGKLTAPWRKQNPHLLDSPAAPWREVEVSDVLTSKPTNGRSVKDRTGGFKVLRLTALKNGKIDLHEYKEGDWEAADAANHVVRKGDFLLSRGNGSIKLVGRGGVVLENADIAFPDTMIRLPLDLEQVDPSFFVYLWNSEQVRRQIENSARTTAGIYKINQSLLTRYRLPLCSLPEQREIVRLLDEQFTVIEQNEREIDAAVKRSAALRQSILKKAFTGQLVPQDPTDEPASALLERIRKERAEIPSSSSRRTKTKK